MYLLEPTDDESGYLRMETDLISKMLYSTGPWFYYHTSTAALLYRKPASAGMFCGSCSAQDSDKRNTLYLE